MIGTTLDKYQVLQKVGEGGMATVYRGRHSTLGRTVAIKVLHPHLSSSVRNRTRFAREVKAMGELLQHENVLEILDASREDESDCYLVTEFVDGETLTRLLEKRGRLPSEVVAQIGRSLAGALSYAHTQGVLHRDVKTDNVMVRCDGTIKLMDFGIARFLDESQVTMTGALVGSPAFMSPEQAQDAPLDQRSDLFALGTVLFYLVTGHLPFTGTNPSVILKNVIEGNRPHVAELAPTMSAALADVIERLMATNPADRFTLAADVATHLAACLHESRIDPDDPEWSLARWVVDPDEYELRLTAHLERALVEEGRRLLDAGDHLTALRLLNRVLSMDEHNAEVLALVQGLHRDAAPAPIRRSRILGLGTLVVLACAAGVLVAGLWWSDRGAPVVARVEPAAAPEPAPPAPVGVLAPRPERAESPRPEPPRPVGPGPAERTPTPVVASDRAIAASARPDPEPAPAPDQGLALVRLNSGDFLADVYLRGIKLGDTRSDLPLPAGTYELELRSPVFFDHVEKVTVTSGERLVVPVTLRPRPSRVAFAKSWPGACLVSTNGSEVGTLESVGWRVEVDRPDRPVALSVTCPDGRTATERWSNLGAPEVTFEGAR